MKTIKAISDTQQLIPPAVAGYIEVLSSLGEADFPLTRSSPIAVQLRHKSFLAIS
jgi:hypothetical protein